MEIFQARVLEWVVIAFSVKIDRELQKYVYFLKYLFISSISFSVIHLIFNNPFRNSYYPLWKTEDKTVAFKQVLDQESCECTPLGNQVESNKDPERVPEKQRGPFWESLL